jgi:hypothetical protein
MSTISGSTRDGSGKLPQVLPVKPEYQVGTLAGNFLYSTGTSGWSWCASNQLNPGLNLEIKRIGTDRVTDLPPLFPAACIEAREHGIGAVDG